MIQPMQDELAALVASDLGISDLSPEEQKELIEEFGKVALASATTAILKTLSEEHRGEFARLAEAGDAAELSAFLAREAPEHEAIAKAAIAEEVRLFKDIQTGGADK